MRRRLYFLLPNLTNARNVVDELLLARVEDAHIHVLAKRGVDLEDLPEAGILQKTDLVHGAQLGMLTGAPLGAAVGALLVAFPPGVLQLQLVTILILTLCGAVFGIWVGSLTGAGVPNSRLKQFQIWIDQGKFLVMADVPFSQQERIAERISRHHPQAVAAGMEPSIPAFP